MTVPRGTTARKKADHETGVPGWSNFLPFPVAAFEEKDADGGHGSFGDDHGPIDASSAHAGVDGQKIGQGNFEHPKGEKIDDGRRDRVAGAVEGLQHNHGVGVADVAVAEDAQRGRGERKDGGVVGEQANNRVREKDQEDADDSKKQHVVEAGAPD